MLVSRSSPKPASDRDSFHRWFPRAQWAGGVTNAVVALGAVALIGYLDRVSGSEVSFSVFYLFPIVYCVWFMSEIAGLVAAVFCAAVWYAIEATFAPVYSHPFIPVWNACARLVFFVLGVCTVALFRQGKDRLQRTLEREKRNVREESERRGRVERELLEMSMNEQVRIAQDLHDGLGQYLSAAMFQARVLADELIEQQSPFAARAERVIELIRTTSHRTRQLDQALRVPASKDGFCAAVCALAAECEELSGVRFEAATDDQPVFLDDFRMHMLFRIVQEGFSNALKHGAPRRVGVRVQVEARRLIIRIADDGKGPSERDADELGTGLRVMRLRAELIGGSLSTGRGDEEGFAVVCSVPLSDQEMGNADADKVS